MITEPLSARDQIAPAYQLSALDHSQAHGDHQVAGRLRARSDQPRTAGPRLILGPPDGPVTFKSISLCHSERLSETLFIGQPLQRLSSAAPERPQKNRRTFCDDNMISTAASDNFHTGGQGQAVTRRRALLPVTSRISIQGYPRDIPGIFQHIPDEQGRVLPSSVNAAPDGLSDH